MGYVCFGEEAGARNLVVFPCKVVAAGDERYLVCAAVAVGVVPDVMGFSSVFCNEWLCLCASFYAFLESVVADRIGVAA